MNDLPLFDRPQPAVETKRAANRALSAGGSASQADRIEAAILESSSTGMIAEELAAALALRIQSVTARLVDLREAGRIVDSGSRRETSSGRLAVCWVHHQVVGRARMTEWHDELAPTDEELSLLATLPRPPRCIGAEINAERCKCGSRLVAEITIAGGRTRRDCLQCGKFLDFG